MKQRGDPVEIKIIQQGAILVNFASIDLDAGDMVGIFIDLKSKRAQGGSSFDWEGIPSVEFFANEYTLHTDQTKGASTQTLVAFPEYEGWEVYAFEGPGRYTAKVVLAKKEAKQ